MVIIVTVIAGWIASVFVADWVYHRRALTSSAEEILATHTRVLAGPVDLDVLEPAGR